jgi:hypothetical protein
MSKPHSLLHKDQNFHCFGSFVPHLNMSVENKLYDFFRFSFDLFSLNPTYRPDERLLYLFFVDDPHVATSTLDHPAEMSFNFEAEENSGDKTFFDVLS